jgi:hypothetical protein
MILVIMSKEINSGFFYSLDLFSEAFLFLFIIALTLTLCLFFGYIIMSRIRDYVLTDDACCIL